MRNPSTKTGRWLDIFMLSTAGVLLFPIVALSLAPVALTFMVLWPLLILPIVAVPRALPRKAPRRPRKPRGLGLAPVPQPA